MYLSKKVPQLSIKVQGGINTLIMLLAVHTAEDIFKQLQRTKNKKYNLTVGQKKHNN